MKIKHGMILAAGLGKRMQPLTLSKPKPLINIGNKTLLERALHLLLNNGVNVISINVHHLSDQIEKYISRFNSKANIKISYERDLLLDTGGGVKEGTKFFKDHPFFVINPDTLWGNNYSREIKLLEKIYFTKKKPCLLVVNKKLSFDTSFKGDFNLKNKIISKDIQNNYIFTGLQVIDRKYLKFIDKKVFSMNELWKRLIVKKNLCGIESKQKFYHLNTLEMYKKISHLNFID